MTQRQLISGLPNPNLSSDLQWNSSGSTTPFSDRHLVIGPDASVAIADNKDKDGDDDVSWWNAMLDAGEQFVTSSKPVTTLNSVTADKRNLVLDPNQLFS